MLKSYWPPFIVWTFALTVPKQMGAKSPMTPGQQIASGRILHCPALSEGNRSSKPVPTTFAGLIALSPLGFKLTFSERFPFELIKMFWNEIVWQEAQHCECTVSYTPLDFTLKSSLNGTFYVVCIIPQ